MIEEKLSSSIVFNQILLLLREKLMSKELSPGTPITEKQVQQWAIKEKIIDASSTSMSATREALRTLVAEGLIEQTETGRRRVRILDGWEKGQIVSIRLAMETTAVAMLVRKCADIEEVPIADREKYLLKMKLAVDEIGAISTQEDPQIIPFIRADMAFHDSISNLSGLTYYRTILKMIHAKIFLGGYGLVLNKEEQQKIFKEHLSIYEAILNNDAERACSLLAYHVVRGGRKWKMEGEVVMPPDLLFANGDKSNPYDDKKKQLVSDIHPMHSRNGSELEELRQKVSELESVVQAIAEQINLRIL